MWAITLAIGRCERAGEKIVAERVCSSGPYTSVPLGGMTEWPKVLAC